MKNCKKKLIGILRKTLNFILLILTWITTGIIISAISVILNIHMDVMVGITVGIVFILFGIYDMFFIKKLLKKSKMPFKVIGWLGIVALFYIGISLCLEGIIMII